MTTITARRPSATVIKEQIIPPKEYLGIELRKGQRLRIIDVEGKQVFVGPQQPAHVVPPHEHAPFEQTSPELHEPHCAPAVPH